MSEKKKLDINKIVNDCKRIAANHIKNWSPQNDNWPVIEGAAYLRLSTDEQVLVEKGSLEQQVHLAISEAESRSKLSQTNYKIINFYIEPGISGQHDRRKEFIALKRNINKGVFQFIVFKEIARIARDGFLWKQFFKLCQDKKCEVIIRGLPIDPNDPASILQLDILAAFAEYEAKNTSKRIRDSVYSAMLNNGKFNSTHQVLGLDPIEINGEKKVGLYKQNEEELRSVDWIMRTFLKYGSHSMTLKECARKGVSNKNGKPFLRHSLITLLSNSKYIGKWYLNPDNKDKSQDRLSPNEKYHAIDLPHGVVVDENLWNQVQKKLDELANSSGKHKNGSNRVYSLSSGLLRFEDGSHFKGYCGNGKTQSSFYYRNVKHKINIRADLIEADALKVLTSIIKKEAAFQDAVKKYGVDVADHFQFLETQLSKLREESLRIQSEKRNYMENLTLLLKSCSNPDEMVAIKDGFKSHLEEFNLNFSEVETRVIRLTKELHEARSNRFSWSNLDEQVGKVLGIIADNEPLALKMAFRALFEAVVIGPENDLGIRTISYILSEESHEDIVGPRLELVEAEGIEPSSASDPQKGATYLVYILFFLGASIDKIP